MTYLEAHPPASPQYRRPRRAKLTGAIVVHDAESATDEDGEDTSAEGVAAFIARRLDAGSYHDIVDRDSTVHLIPYDWEAFHEGTGGNRWSLGLSFAYGSKRMPSAAWWGAALPRGAAAARAMAEHVKATTGTTVPARRITAAQYRAGAAGFISHAELDPTRRRDPVGFPWDPFLSLYANTTPTNPEAPTMPTTPSAAQEAAQRAVNGWLVPELQIDPDGKWGDKSTAALVLVLKNAEATIKRQASTVLQLNAEMATVQQANTISADTITRLRAEVDRLNGLADVQGVRAALDRLLPELQAAADELGRLGGA